MSYFRKISSIKDICQGFKCAYSDPINKNPYSYTYLYPYTYLYDSEIVYHNPCFNSFILHISFDNKGSQINKNNFFYALTYCLLQKLSSYANFLYICAVCI